MNRYEYDDLDSEYQAEHPGILSWRGVFFILVAALALLLYASIVKAADLPRKAPLAVPAPIVTPSPFWIGAFAGIGLSPTENELTIDGTAMGVQKAWPTGLLVGLAVGYENINGPLAWGFEVRGGYDFSRGGVDCSDVNMLAFGSQCLASRKNGWLIQENAELGISLTTIGGLVPGSAQPSNWPIPITVPTSVWSNVVIAARGGFAQRNVDLCAVIDPASGATACGSKFTNAPSAGLKLKFMISAQTELFATYDHVFWAGGSSFTPTAATPLFQNAVAIKQEDIFAGGFGYHF